MKDSLELKKAKSKFEMIGTKAVKLKDHPNKRRYVMIDIRSYFGTIPEVIVIEKVLGSNNTIIVKGIVPRKKVKEPKTLKKPIKSALGSKTTSLN
jgi:hypothetical protein